MDWVLYDIGLGRERVKAFSNNVFITKSLQTVADTFVIRLGVSVQYFTANPVSGATISQF